MKQHLISVDLGGSKVTVALGRLSHNGEVVVVDAVSKPMDGFTRGEVTNIEHVTSAIREAVGEIETHQGVKIDEVWVSVSGRHIVSANNSGFVYVGGTDGEITDSDVRKLHENMANVQAPESKVILARIPQNYKVDANETIGSPVGRFGNKLETTFSFVLAGKVALERISKAFQRAGVEKCHFVAGAMASGEIAASEEEKESGVIVVDLGAGSTDLCIIQNKIVRHIASIPVGSAAINNDIRSTGIPVSLIEKLKVRYGFATTSTIPAEKLNLSISIKPRSTHQKNKEITYRDLATIIEARMLDIIEFVNSEIRASGYHNRLPSGIILTGGGSKLAGVEVLFKERTGYDVRLGAAEGDISAESMEGTSAPELATAIGLLAMGIAEGSIMPTAPVVDNNAEEEDEESDVDVPNPPTHNNIHIKDKGKGNNKGNGGEVEGPKPKGGFFKWLSDVIFGDVVDDEMQ
ncbi:MAG: cell division protein FtsA [Tidjanibacter sp.]|nr:cell division protein FtsA [Tidjanibacter sp.]